MSKDISYPPEKHFQQTALLPGLRNWMGEDIYEIGRNFSLLNVDFQLTNECNYDCIYCSSISGKKLENELKLIEIKSFFNTCKELKVKSITLTGGEPLLRKDFLDIINFLNKNNFKISMFTNGSLISEEIADTLFKNKVAICLKLDTLNEKSYNCLTRTNDEFNMILNKVQILKDIGYTYELPLSINSVITSENVKEIPKLWAWARKNGIIPNCERLLTKGRARNGSLSVRPRILKELYEEIWKIDNNLGIHWDLKIPFFGHVGCIKHYCSIYVTSNGRVIPCPGVDISYGDLRKEEFKDILEKIQIEKMNLKSKIKGKCSICEKSDICYGCRGLAYNLSGDYLESDPLCWFE